MPSLRIRCCRVGRFIPGCPAAPHGPATSQLDRSKASRIRRRSVFSRTSRRAALFSEFGAAAFLSGKPAGCNFKNNAALRDVLEKRSEEHTSELQSLTKVVSRLLLD